MNVLICGADGFVGRHLCSHLQEAGHHIIRGVRTPRTPSDIAIDYSKDCTPDVWIPRLLEVDVVINAIGILIETVAQPFDVIHKHAPIALFDACATLGGIKVIQISALGADRGRTNYFLSKLAAERYLEKLHLDWYVVRPSLIYGEDGGSSRVFRLMASLPIVSLPGDGSQPLQPIHIEDLCTCIQALVDARASLKRTYELAGTQIISYKELLTIYRRSMGLGKPIYLPIPMTLMSITAQIAEYLPQRVLSRDTLSMLVDGNTTQSTDALSLIRRDLIPAEKFISPMHQQPLRQEAIDQWALPLLRITLAFMWIAAGFVSLVQPTVALKLLAPLGVQESVAVGLLYSASFLNLVLGLLTIARPSQRLWLVQISVVFGYTLIISSFLPEYWLHPFGPIVKNLPILGLLIMLYAHSTKKT